VALTGPTRSLFRPGGGEVFRAPGGRGPRCRGGAVPDGGGGAGRRSRPRRAKLDGQGALFPKAVGGTGWRGHCDVLLVLGAES